MSKNLADLFSTVIVDASFAGQADMSTGRVTGIAEPRRRFESAATDRLNEAHWQLIGSDDINMDLHGDIEALQRRSRHEAQNNPILEGAMSTHATDVVGEDGPLLSVISEDTAWADALEKLFRDWAEQCEYSEGLALADLLQGWVHQWWYNGEILVQEVIGRNAMDYRLNDLGAESFETFAPGQQTICGVELDQSGRVVAYHVSDPGTAANRARLPVEFALHAYRRRFARQRRGIPLTASNLQSMADLRDFDDQVMDAARAAADQAVWMVATGPDVDFVNVEPGTKTQTERRVVRHAPPGWEPKMMAGTQPQNTYVEFVREKQRNIGSPAMMPLIVLRHDASRSNMSSARFDANRYLQGVKVLQAQLRRRVLNKVVTRLARFGVMDGTLPRRLPEYALSWTWPKPPGIDPLKDAMAERIGLENGTVTYGQACAARGHRADAMIDMRSRENQQLKDAGLPPISGALPMPLDSYGQMIDDLDAADESQPDTPDDDLDELAAE
jgi:capsid protein